MINSIAHSFALVASNPLSQALFHSNVHCQKQPSLAQRALTSRPLVQHGNLKADPAQVFGQVFAALGAAVEADDQLIAVDAVSPCELEEGGQTITKSVSENFKWKCAVPKKDGSIYLRRFQVLSDDLLVEEDEHGALGAFFRHKTAEARPGGVVIVDFQILLDHSSSRQWRVRRGAGRRRRSRERRLTRTLLHWYRGSVSVCLLRHSIGRAFMRAVLIKRTHHQRVPRGATVLLNQERGPERLAEESLTLFRDVVCGGVSAAAAAAILCSDARRRRWGWDARSDLKPTTPLLE